ncbi:MAG: metal ABC transporter permease [Anaerolineales bacterium]
MQSMSAEDRQVYGLIVAVLVGGALFIPFSTLVLGVDYDYTLRTVALGGSVLGMVSGVLGCFAVLRHESLMGDALSHAALPGVGVAFLLAGRDLGALLIGAGLASWLGVQFIRAVMHTTRIKQDTAMGIVLAAWFAAGIALLTYIQGRADASQAGLDAFIFGQAAAMVRSDVELISVVGLASFIILALFWKEFKLVTFDAAFAQANGYRVGFFNGLLSTLIVIAIVLGLQLAGVILMVGMLIAPGIAARQWTHKLDQMVILAALFGAFAGGVGAVLSALDANLPTGPMIIVVAFGVVMVSLAFAPDRGILWAWARQRTDRRRFAAQTVLRDAYKYALAHGTAYHPVPDGLIRGVGGAAAATGLEQLAQDGYLKAVGDTWQLTATGAELAAQDAHNQRLWDVYRQYGDELKLPLVQEDRQRDIHEVLPPPLVEKLERKLQGGAR